MKDIMRTKYFAILAILLVQMLVSCANVGYPTGGEVDKTPPKSTAFVPENETRNFTSNSISIYFDEYIQLKNVDNQVLISPPFEQKPEIVAKGKYVNIKIKDTLRSNTTYLFQFKNAIADNNEGNILPSLDYVFSTGATIDSFSFKGIVVDALTQKPDEDIYVFLYNDFSDSVVAISHPIYLTKTDKNGVFEFKYIAQGKYKIIALKDDDKSMTYNNITKKMAFKPEAIESYYVQDSCDTVNVRLNTFVQVSETQRITSNNLVKNGKAVVTTFIPLTNPKITSPDNDLIVSSNKNRDTLQIWARQPVDSLMLFIKDETGIDDTLNLRYFSKKGKKQKETFFKSNIKSTFPYFDTIKITFTNPIDTICDTANFVYIKTQTDSFYTYLLFDSIKLNATVLLRLEADSNYQIIIPKDRLTDIYGNKNDTILLKTKINTPGDYGTIKINLLSADSAEQYIVQVLSERDDVIVEKINIDNTIIFQNIKAGKYRIRVIHDTNKNGKWDSGDYWKNQQPESVYYLDKVLELRNNWEIEEDISF